MIYPTLFLNETFAAPVDGKVYGIHSATQGFVRAFLDYARPAELRFRTDKEDVRVALRDEAARADVPMTEIERADDINRCAMYFSVPQADAFWLRRSAGAARYAICGVHHSLTGAGLSAHMRDLIFAPTEPWDALICTSRASRDAVQRMVEGWTDFLASRGGALPEPRLQFPVIPLGVDTGTFRPAKRDRFAATGLRAKLGIPPDALAVLFLGRLNFSSKAHPLPMFQALERARSDSGRPIHLLQAGWFPSDAVAEATAALAREASASVVHHHIGSVSGAGRGDVYEAADVFISLTDNIQETFGLTLVEAMASGLPVVATDWDGYRDTVVDGVTGFLVPTTMAPAGAGREIGLAAGLGGRPYNRSLMDAAQATSVDVDAVTRAVVALGADPVLRSRMGEAGRRRAEALFDWRVVIAAYRELWAELDDRRNAEGASDSSAVDDPLHPDPFRVFSGFASRRFDTGALLRLHPDWRARFRMGTGSPILRAQSDLLLDAGGMQRLVQALYEGAGVTCAGLCTQFGDEAGRTTRSLFWLMKLGAVEVA